MSNLESAARELIAEANPAYRDPESVTVPKWCVEALRAALPASEQSVACGDVSFLGACVVPRSAHGKAHESAEGMPWAVTETHPIGGKP
jgi:hypothetical protein